MSEQPSLWRADHPLVLASRSAARQALCAAAGIPIECVPADIDERGVQAAIEREGGSPAQVALVLAQEKALTVAARMPGRLVVGSDQTLALGSDTLSKPADRAAAARQLAMLSGRTHELHAAVAVTRDGDILFDAVRTAQLTVRDLSSAFIDLYLDVAGDDVCGSVGAYQLEGLGIHLFESIDGDQTTILGMPMLPLIEFLRADGSLAA